MKVSPGRGHRVGRKTLEGPVYQVSRNCDGHLELARRRRTTSSYICYVSCSDRSVGRRFDNIEAVKAVH